MYKVSVVEGVYEKKGLGEGHCGWKERARSIGAEWSAGSCMSVITLILRAMGSHRRV